MVNPSLLVLVVAAAGCAGAQPVTAPAAPPAAAVELRHPDEVHLAELRQLTAGGENAEAYWSFAGTELIFQSTRPPWTCDQILRVPADGSAEPALVSTGQGRTTCAYFLPGDQHVIYASTHAAGPACPPVPDHSQGYVWPLYDTYDIYKARRDGSALTNLTDRPGYDAEATVCAKDGSIVFTSTRDGDLELYRMDADGGNVVRLTDAPGYDGGAFFSPDCAQIVWRASRPQGDELADFRRLLGQGLVRPTRLELFVANADGSEARQVTYLGAASFAPYFYPDGERIIFSTNYPEPRGREFDLWAVDVDGSRLERITHSPGFDGFPMFSPDGTRLAFASNRNQGAPGETNLFVARWVDAPVPARPDDAADQVRADVAWLADDARTGRGVGTEGLAAAADWLAARFAALGLAPAGAEGSFKQPFEVVVGVLRGPATGLRIDGKAVAAEAFVPAGFSGEGKVAGATVFAGYGITSAEHGIDDYARVAGRGKVVVVRRFAPADGPLAEPALQRRFGDLRYKAWNAREHGATALIVIDLPPADEAPLPALAVEQGSDAGLPVVLVRRAAGAALARGRHRVALEVELERVLQPVHNVVGVVRAGAATRKPGAVLVGAHYDHLGWGGHGSLAPDARAVHNGADDNASGTAALLRVAAAVVAARDRLERDVYLVAFSAEESGVLGSTHFTRAPPPGLAMADLIAMLNMDMVGRLRGNRVSVLGAESAADWPDLVGPACRAAGLECSLSGDGYGPSDQTPFYAAGVPVLHFFTGAHADYHKPSDDTAAINAAGLARIADLVGAVAIELAGRAERLTYQAAPSPGPVGDVRSYGASLGTIPDYAGAPGGKPGVLLAGVRPGSPAETGGLRRGDLMVAIGGRPVRDVSDFMFVLRSAKPGDKAVVVVERAGQRVELEVTFGQAGRR